MLLMDQNHPTMHRKPYIIPVLKEPDFLESLCNCLMNSNLISLSEAKCTYVPVRAQTVKHLSNITALKNSRVLTLYAP